MGIENTLWIDLETTGLDPTLGGILEIGAEVIRPDFTSVDYFTRVVRREQSELQKANMPSEVWGQHRRSGLIDAVLTSPYTWDQVEKTFLDFVKAYFPKGNAIICGNSIHFDRKWLDLVCPEVTKLFHYRMIDVTSIHEAHRIFGAPHRVREDIKASQEKLRELLQLC